MVCRFFPLRLLRVLVLILVACAPVRTPKPPALDWAIALHGGAGAIPRDTPAEERDRYLASLQAALQLGVDRLDAGAGAMDVVEEVVRLLEDDPLFNAGKGAVFNLDGVNELDASIMDGRDLSCGAVAGVTTVKNPISLARKVMEATPHVLLAADGAEAFADEMGVERVSPEYYYTERRWQALQEARSKSGAEPHGTVGVVALDRDGHLAAATSTGELTAKRFGRIGDSPIIGAGTYADDRTCAVSATGQGEEFIRHGVARTISLLMENGRTVRQAAADVVGGRLRPGDGGIVAVAADGAVAMVYNTDGMFRGAADASGRFEVHIWEAP